MMRRLLLALPIILIPNLGYIPLETGIPGLNLANLLLLVAVAAVALSSRSTSPAAAGTGLLTPPLVLLFIALAIATVIGMLGTPQSPMDDITRLKDFLFYPLFYFLYRRCREDRAGTRRLIWLTLIVAIVAGIDAVLQGMRMDTLSTFADTNRVAGPFGDYHSANRAGVFFAMFLPMLAAAMLFLRGHRFKRAVATAGVGILIIAVLLTYSRQSYLIVVVLLALLVVRKHVLLAFGLAAMLAVVAIPALTLVPPGVVERVMETRQESAVGGPELDVSTASRFEIWGGAMRMWADHPAGVGLGRFPDHIGNYSEFSNYDAHNMYVLMLAECGPLGLLAMLWLVWRLLRLGLRATRMAHDHESLALGIGFSGAVVAMAMGNLYGSPFNEGVVMANFWILAGLMERYCLLGQSVAAPVPASLASRIHDRFPLAGEIAPGRYQGGFR